MLWYTGTRYYCLSTGGVFFFFVYRPRNTRQGHPRHRPLQGWWGSGWVFGPTCRMMQIYLEEPKMLHGFILQGGVFQSEAPLRLHSWTLAAEDLLIFREISQVVMVII